MPTYDYVCSKCDHAFEQFQSMSAKPLRKCPSCGGQSLRRLIGTGAGIIFKGSGFYETDYRSESYQKAAKADKSQAADKKTQGAEKPTTGADKSTTSDGGAGSSCSTHAASTDAKKSSEKSTTPRKA
jgi:putative FmdB family regulatory protein